MVADKFNVLVVDDHRRQRQQRLEILFRVGQVERLGVDGFAFLEVQFHAPRPDRVGQSVVMGVVARAFEKKKPMVVSTSG